VLDGRTGAALGVLPGLVAAGASHHACAAHPSLPTVALGFEDAATGKAAVVTVDLSLLSDN